MSFITRPSLRCIGFALPLRCHRLGRLRCLFSPLQLVALRGDLAEELGVVFACLGRRRMVVW